MLTIILTCLVLAGESLTLTPPTGWEVVKITGKPVAHQEEAGALQSCRLLGNIEIFCGPLPFARTITPGGAAVAEVIVKRRLLVEEVTVPKGCDVRVEREDKQP